MLAVAASARASATSLSREAFIVSQASHPVVADDARCDRRRTVERPVLSSLGTVSTAIYATSCRTPLNPPLPDIRLGSLREGDFRSASVS